MEMCFDMLSNVKNTWDEAEQISLKCELLNHILHWRDFNFIENCDIKTPKYAFKKIVQWFNIFKQNSWPQEM